VFICTPVRKCVGYLFGQQDFRRSSQFTPNICDSVLLYRLVESMRVLFLFHLNYSAALIRTSACFLCKCSFVVSDLRFRSLSPYARPGILLKQLVVVCVDPFTLLRCTCVKRGSLRNNWKPMLQAPIVRPNAVCRQDDDRVL
jgi:hypothetical protein